jgi:site-specific DNA-methyltransferase (adenine-specific)
VLVFSAKQSVYNPQKTKGRPYRCRSSAAGETTQDQTVAGWVTNNKDGLRYPVSWFFITSETGLHPTQKPVALFEYLIKTYTNPGDLVLDNCSGSGTTAIACINTGRHYIGIEKDQHYYEVAKNRIREATPRVEL